MRKLNCFKYDEPLKIAKRGNSDYIVSVFLLTFAINNKNIMIMSSTDVNIQIWRDLAKIASESCVLYDNHIKHTSKNAKFRQ